MALDKIVIKGARQNNLKNIDLEIPRDRLIVFTGLSGSGKTSLAFDTIYADGQRRYVESLSSYARMFLGQAEKPDVDEISGLSPAISIDQKTTSKNPRSTVGTVTEIYDYLRLLYARVGIPHCPICGREISQQTVDQMVDKVLALPEGTRIQVMAPIVRQRKGTYQKELDSARRSGYVRARVDGNMYELTEEIKLEKNYKHTIEIVVDRLSVKPEIRSRLADSIETCCAMTGGLVVVDVVGGEEMPALTMISPSRSFPPICFPLTIRREAAPPAPGWACSKRLTRRWWCATPTVPSGAAPSRYRAGAATPVPLGRCTSPGWKSTSVCRWISRSRICRRISWTLCCSAPRGKSSRWCGIPPGLPGSSPMTSKVLSITLSGALRRPPATG